MTYLDNSATDNRAGTIIPGFVFFAEMMKMNLQIAGTLLIPIIVKKQLSRTLRFFFYDDSFFVIEINLTQVSVSYI